MAVYTVSCAINLKDTLCDDAYRDITD